MQASSEGAKLQALPRCASTDVEEIVPSLSSILQYISESLANDDTTLRPNAPLLPLSTKQKNTYKWIQTAYAVPHAANTDPRSQPSSFAHWPTARSGRRSYPRPWRTLCFSCSRGLSTSHDSEKATVLFSCPTTVHSCLRTEKQIDKQIENWCPGHASNSPAAAAESSNGLDPA